MVGGRGARCLGHRSIDAIDTCQPAPTSASHIAAAGVLAPSVRPCVRRSCDGLLNGGTSGSVACVHATVLCPAATSRVVQTIAGSVRRQVAD